MRLLVQRAADAKATVRSLPPQLAAAVDILDNGRTQDKADSAAERLERVADRLYEVVAMLRGERDIV